MALKKLGAAEEVYISGSDLTYAGNDTFTISTGSFSLTQAATTVVYIIPDLANYRLCSFLFTPTGATGVGELEFVAAFDDAQTVFGIPERFENKSSLTAGTLLNAIPAGAEMRGLMSLDMITALAIRIKTAATAGTGVLTLGFRGAP